MRGMGLMMCLVVMSQLAMATLPLARIKSASGVYNLTRNIGGAIGLAIINTILDQQQALHYTQLASQIVPDRLEVVDYLNEQTRQLAATYGDRAYGVALSNLYRDAKLDALVLSFNDLLKGLALLMVLVSLLVWTLKRPPANRDVGPAH
jgi:DHA2 family multidrug resistance protein